MTNFDANIANFSKIRNSSLFYTKKRTTPPKNSPLFPLFVHFTSTHITNRKCLLYRKTQKLREFLREELVVQ